MDTFVLVSLVLLVSLIVLTGSYQLIMMVILDVKFKSGYFNTIATSVQITIFYSVLRLGTYLVAKLEKRRRGNYESIQDYGPIGDIESAHSTTQCSTKRKMVIVGVAGVCNALMSLLMVYATNPLHTPVLLQSAFSPMTMFFSVMMSKLLLKKSVQYNLRLIIPSMLCLVTSLVLPCVYISDEMSNMTIGWTVMYSLSLFFLATYNVLQEK
ncbi:hypothetical protein YASMINEVIRUS_55 [Yasminevirus sp. GU-2018]|uniref:Uncharacterized protein n=1 Tax=Yasminevirus sp. GU-2018 TaxID=2420051 RepID=A0A5K0U883_9VIRU|nr:hypothetical protein YASMINEVIRUS_55 [Yasminevirus sp. GU-2018]